MFKEREKALELSPSVTRPALSSVGMKIALLLEVTMQMLGEKKGKRNGEKWK